MRFCIFGAGGIGCYYGARLLQAGHVVTLVARGPHLKAMQQKGLTVEHPDFSFHQSVHAIDEGTLLATLKVSDFDVIMLCFKSQDTAPWLSRMHEWLHSGSAPVLSIQNGVDNEVLIAEAVDLKRTIGGLAVKIGGHITAPGTVSVDGPAHIIMGAWPNKARGYANAAFLVELDNVFKTAHIPSMVTEHIGYELWRKLMINNGVNPLSALTGLDTRSLCQHTHYQSCVLGLMQEAASVAVADNVILTDADVQEMFQLILGFDAIKTSMLVDKERGRPLELDGITGAVIRRGNHLKIPTPLTHLVQGLLTELKP